MNPVYLRRALGGTGVALGFCWIGYFAFSLWQVLRNGMVDAAFDFSFTWILMFMMLVPGIIAVISGLSLFRAPGAESIRWITGIALVTVLVPAFVRVELLLPDLLPDGIQSNLAFLLCTLASLPLFTATLRYLYRRLAVSGPEYSTLVNRGALFVVAIQIWMLLTGIFMEHRFPGDDVEPGYGILWDMLKVFGPILVACGLYQGGCRYLDAARAREGAAIGAERS